MKSVYAESRRGEVDTKLNHWGETTWISGLTARRSQSAPLIDRQHFDLQRWLLHGDTNHNRDVCAKLGRRKRTFKSSDTSSPAPLFLSFSFTHPLIYALDGFHGCCVNCLLLSLLWFSILSLLHPSPCWFISPLSFVKKNWVKALLKFPYSMPCSWFTSRNFSPTRTNTRTCHIQCTIMSSLCRRMQNSGCFGFWL